jgi:catechol 2,3-dioxygenase-like lactoylglutathione lyase family enzyme
MLNPGPQLPLSPHGVLETSLYVDDLDAAEYFYSALLSLRKHSSHPGRHVFFYCGQSVLLLFHSGATRVAVPGPVADGGMIPPHGSSGPGHVAFRIHESELTAWKERLAVMNVDVESEIVWPQGGRSLYFRDPAGNSLELATPKLWGFLEEEPE